MLLLHFGVLILLFEYDIMDTYNASAMVLIIFMLLQIFFLQGRFIFGPDVRSLALTIFLIVAPVAVFCVFVARKLMDDYAHHWGISIMVVAVVFTVYVSSLSYPVSLIEILLLSFCIILSSC